MNKLKWWQRTIVYQVYPKSFLDTTGTGQGDIPGITRRLDYLKTLGVGAIWLTPVYPSPMVDNGYDISNYTDIDPSYGTPDDMDELIAEAKKRDIRIVMDLVFNHSSDQHAWFLESRQSRDNAKSDWYIWRDAKPDGSAPTNWRSIFGGSAWTWCEERQQYYLHTFAPQQPDLNWENPAVRQALYDAANFWLDRGVGGFRIDAIVYIKKPAEFRDYEPDGPDGLKSIHDVIANTPGILDFLHEFRANVFDGHDIFTVGEANGVPPEHLDQWVGNQGVFSMLFEFSHMDVMFPDGEKWSHAQKFPLTAVKKALSESQKATAQNGWYPIFFENHDQPRAIDKFFRINYGERVEPQRAAKVIATVLMTLRGTPFVFEGEELGLDNVAWPDIEDYNDISSHGQYDLAIQEGFTKSQAMDAVHHFSRDNARTPMQWSGEQHEAGFTSGTPWLPVHSDYRYQNVESESTDAGSVLSYYRQLARLRLGKCPGLGDDAALAGDILQAGDYEELLTADECIYAFRRQLPGSADSIVTIVNFSPDLVVYPRELTEQGRLIMANNVGRESEPQPGSLPGFGAAIYLIKGVTA